MRRQPPPWEASLAARVKAADALNAPLAHAAAETGLQDVVRAGIGGAGLKTLVRRRNGKDEEGECGAAPMAACLCCVCTFTRVACHEVAT